MRKFLIVVDMQNDFITGPLGSDAAIAAKDEIKAYIKTLAPEDHIIFTKDTHDKRAYPYTREGEKLPVLHCIKDTHGWHLNEDLFMSALWAVKPSNVHIVNKDTFGTLDIGQGEHAILNQLSIKPTDEIIICGVCTDICVISNALILHSQFPACEMKCYSNMCGGTSVEAHEAALKVMRSCQIEVI